MYRILHILMCVISIVSEVIIESNNTIYIAVITEEETTNSTQKISASDIMNSSEVPHGMIDIQIIWTTLHNYSLYTFISTVERLIRKPDILVVPEEFDSVIQHGRGNSDIVWFSQNKFSESLWNKGWVKRTPRLACPMCKQNWDVEIEDTSFTSCASNSEMATVELGHVVDIITQLEWKRVLIIYDRQSELKTNEIVDNLSTRNVKVWLYTFDETIFTYQKYPGFKKVYDESGKSVLNVLVVCSQQCINDVLDEANKFDRQYANKTALKLWSRWLISQQNVNKTSLEHGRLDIDNIAVMMDPRKDICLSTNLEKDVFTVIREMYFDMSIGNCTSSLTNITHIKADILQKFKRKVPTNEAKLATLLWKFEHRELAEINSNKYTNNEIFPNSNFHFNNRKFIVSTNEWPPFTMVTQSENKTVFSGICVDLLEELSISLNFSFELIEPPDLEWGVEKDGVWSGVIGQLARHEVDLVVAAITIQDSREVVMDFSFPYFYDYTGIFVKKADPGKNKWFTLLAPFKWQVLICIGCALLFATFFLYIIEHINPFYKTRNKMACKFTLDGSLWYLLGALFAHGGVHIPSTMASRILIGCWWLFSIIMAATYSGNLIAFLTVTKDKLPFESLSEMIKQNDYTWGTMGASVSETLFKTSTIPSYKAIWNNIQEFAKDDPDVLNSNIDVHLKKILDGNYAFMTDRSVMASWSKYSCNISLLPDNFFPNHYALGLPNHSPYLDIFNDQMIQIYESGLLQLWQKRWWPKASICPESLKTKADAVDLQSLQSAFYLIAIGVFTALMMLLGEITRFRKQICVKHL